MEQQATDPRRDALIELCRAADSAPASVLWDAVVDEWLKTYEGIFTTFPAREVDPHAEEFADLRDQFAMAALQGIMFGDHADGEGDDTRHAKLAYKYADAMMKARKAGAK